MTKRYNIGAVKIPEAERDVAHDIPLRGYLDLIGSDVPDDDDQFPVGTNTTYSRELTEEEAERFRNASNARYVEEDSIGYPCYGVDMPKLIDRTYQNYPGEESRWHGRDIIIGICDSGVSNALITLMNWTLVASGWFYGNPAPADTWGPHGSGCAALAVPYGGKVINANVSIDASQNSNESTSVLAWKFCVDNGAKIINYSHGHLTGGSAFLDAATYAAAAGCEIFCSAGNRNMTTLLYPAAMAPQRANIHAVGAFDTATGVRSTFSDHNNTLTGVAPGTNVSSYDQYANVWIASGTSFASPLSASICARLCTGGRFTPSQVGAAMKANGRKSGQLSTEEGYNGIYDFSKTLAALGGFGPDQQQVVGRNECPNPSCATNSTGWSFSNTASVAGRTLGLTGMDRKSGYVYTKSGTVQNAYANCPQSAPDVNKYSNKQWTFTYQAVQSVTLNNIMQVLFYDATGAFISYVESASVSRAANVVFRNTMVVTCPNGTASVKVQHVCLNLPVSASMYVTGVRYAPGNIPTLAYGDGDSVGWEWDDGLLTGNSESGPAKYGSGLTVG